MEDKMKKLTARNGYFLSHVSYFTLIELLVKITCFSGDLAKAHEV